MSDPVKIDYASSPNPNPGKPVRNIVAMAIGLAVCLVVGISILIMAIAMLGFNHRLSAIFALTSLIFIMQAARLIRKLAYG
jgi:hypothetical protein